MNLKLWFTISNFMRFSVVRVQKVFSLLNLSAPSETDPPFLLIPEPWQGIWVSLPTVSAGDDQKLRLCARLALHFNQQLLA